MIFKGKKMKSHAIPATQLGDKCSGKVLVGKRGLRLK
jgi:hypothetical protein